MSLLTLHRIFIGMAIALCLVYTAFELAHASEHSVLRAALGIGIPALVAGALGAYLRLLLRR